VQVAARGPLRSHALAPQVLERAVARHAIEVGPQRALHVVEVAALRPDLQKDLLDEVFGHAEAVDVAAREAAERFVVRAKAPLERPAVAPADALDQGVGSMGVGVRHRFVFAGKSRSLNKRITQRTPVCQASAKKGVL